MGGFYLCDDAITTCLNKMADESVAESVMESAMESEEGSWLVRMAPEIVHKVALSGWLGVEEVAALSESCRRMAEILVWDEYGRDLHRALLGVVESVRGKRWKAAMYATSRRWFGVGEWGVESVWRGVAQAVVGEGKVNLDGKEEVEGWEHVMLATLSLSGASGWKEAWRWRRRGDEDEDDWEEMTLLHVGASVGSEKVVGWGVERGLDLEVRNSEGDTPLLVGCWDGHVEVVELLVESGASVWVVNESFEDLLLVASFRGHAAVVEYLLGLEVFDVNAKNIIGWTSLYAACRKGHLDVVKVLVEGGGDVDVEGKKSCESPLYLACRHGHVEMVEYLLGAGAWSGVEKDGYLWAEVLRVGVEVGEERMVELLVGGRGVGSGVEVRGERLVDVVAGMGWSRVVELLEEGSGDGDGGGGGDGDGDGGEEEEEE